MWEIVYRMEVVDKKRRKKREREREGERDEKEWGEIEIIRKIVKIWVYVFLINLFVSVFF